MNFDKFVLYSFGFILSCMFAKGVTGLISPLLFRSAITGQIVSSIEQTNKGNTIYITNVVKQGDTDPTPYIIENKLLLGRFDRTTVFARLKTNEDQCISATEYGLRVYTKFYKGLTDIKIYPCK